jgi:hypothetical protein
MTFFRFIPENNNGKIGPDTATARAKELTNHPAVDTLTSKLSAMEGNNPITPISVFKMPKTPMVNMKINKLLRLANKTPLLCPIRQSRLYTVFVGADVVPDKSRNRY